MSRKIIITLGLIAVLASSWAPLRAEEGDGYVLLDKFIMSFQGMAEKGTGGAEVLGPALDSLMLDLVKAKDQKQIDQVFFNRFSRLLQITKLLIVEDEARILAPLINRELMAFVKDVKGEVPEADLQKQRIGVGAIADSLATEIIYLHIYLDTDKKREELISDFMRKFTAPPKKKDEMAPVVLHLP